MNNPTCIYCGEPGQFTDEHIFPAGLGGDDRHFLLKKLVCANCNTGVFSKLEAKFMRNSPVALARIFLQEQGRGSGKKASIPRLDTASNSVVDPHSGHELESGLGAGGIPTVMPQIVISKEKLGLSGPDVIGIRALFDQISSLLIKDVLIVDKQKQSSTVSYCVTTFIWSDDKYNFASTEQLAQPPSGCIWLEPLKNSGDTEIARLFLRPTGQLVLRSETTEQIPEWLSIVRSQLPALSGAELPDPKTIEKPSMHIGMNIDTDAYSRVLAKIGMNIAIHTYGEQYCRDAAFDDIKASVLTGKPSVHMNLDGDMGTNFGEFFSAMDGNSHLMMLASHSHGAGRHSVLFVIRLYGGAVHVIPLARDGAPSPPISEPTFFTVDYGNHIVEQLSLVKLAEKLMARSQIENL